MAGSILTALRTGHDPLEKLPDASFHTQLERQVVCPRCDATYNLIADFDWAASRHFEREAAPLIRQLEKAVFLGHGDGHRIVQFATNGVVVTTPGVYEPVRKQPIHEPATLDDAPEPRSRLIH